MTDSVGSADRPRTDRPEEAPADRLPGRLGRVRRSTVLGIAIPALVAYIPLLLTHPGMVGADTKTYLYLDPGKLLSEVPHVWDSQIGLGTVTHQNIGYLFPMGPFYLFFDAIGVPDWVAQRLWLGTVLFLAAMGVRYLLRTLGSPGPGRTGRLGLGAPGILVASLAYMLSPYILNYSARISVLLLPFTALPWLIALAARSVRHGGWRYPAWFAFTMLLVGGINATAVIMVGAGPALWVVHAVWVDREVRFTRALAAVGRITLLTLLTSLWWMAGLWAEGRYGLPVIRYTESYRTVAEVSSAPEVLRGLGYWLFYGTDKLGPWIEPSVEYTTEIPLLALSYVLPIAAIVVAALVRWRYRAYFLMLVAFGAITAIASHPWDSPSLLGSIFKEFTRSDAGLSLRSTPRAVPLVVLGTAVFLGVGVDALSRWRPPIARPLAAVACVLVILNLPPLWNNTMVADNLERPEDIPSYWLDNAAYLQARGNDTRVLEIPGTEFASYRWGNTVDPVLPGLMDRPYVARELFTWGSPPSANLLNAFDRRLHEETFDPAALVPVAQLMSVGDINVRSDLQYERYRIARPRALWDLIRRAPGLDEPVGFGEPVPNIAGPEQTMIDEVELNTPPGLVDPPPVATFGVPDARGIVNTHPNRRSVLAAADGEGLVDAAAAGILNPDQAFFYSAALVGDPDTFARIYGADADLLLTDTNRARARRWGALRENTGYTERAGETPIVFDPTDQRLDVFPGSGDDEATVSVQRRRAGSDIGATVSATAYGNPITYTPDDRPALALDGNERTAWRVGAIDDVIGEKLIIDLDSPVTTDTVNLLQPINLERSRWITKARLTFDDRESMVVDLDDISRDESGVGQDVAIGSRTFSKLTIEVVEANIMGRLEYNGLSGVGFAEVRIPGVGIDDLIRPPVDLLRNAGASSIDHRFTMLFTRLRSNQAEPVRTDEEDAIRRIVDLPIGRSFGYGGQARLAAGTPDEDVDRLLGLRDASQGGVTARSDVRLPGSLTDRASAAIDDDPSTAWTSIFQNQIGHYIEYVVPQPLGIDHLDLDIVADGHHSVPTSLGIDVDGTRIGSVDIPPIDDLPPVDGRVQEGGTVRVQVPLPAAVTGSTFRFTIEGVREMRTRDWYSNAMTTAPVAIAELGIDGLHLDQPGPQFDSTCVDGLLTIDDVPVPIRVQGSTDDALARRSLPIEPCGSGAVGLTLDAGEHIVRSTPGIDTGIDIDRLVLPSEAGGGPLATADLPSQVPLGPEVTVDAQLAVESTGSLRGSSEPYWLVMGQSWSNGWHAQVGGHDLGTPTLIDGYANGWYVDPAIVGTGDLSFVIEWTPQRSVWIAIGLSAVAMAVCLALMILGGRRPHRPEPLPADPDRPIRPLITGPWPFGPASRRAHRPSVIVAGAISVGFALAAAVNIENQHAYPLAAVAIGAALFVAIRDPRSRSWFALAAAGCYALAASFVVLQQVRHRYVSDFTWPTHFDRVGILALVAIVLLAAEAVLDLVRRRPRTTDDDDQTSP